MKTYFYKQTTDDVVDSAQQNFKLRDDYQIFPTKLSKKIWNKIIRNLAAVFGLVYSHLFLRTKVIGKEKLKPYAKIGYFIYGNHTQPLGDVFIPLTIYPLSSFYAVANQANWGIPIIGKYLVSYGGLPVGNNIRQSSKLISAIKTVITEKKGEVLIYPEAHVWPYYTKIRPFDDTSMHFPVELNAPCFTQTSTYTKTRFFKRPKLTVYIDGPFYPDEDLSRKKRQEKLYNEIRTSLKTRALLNSYKYINYQKIK